VAVLNNYILPFDLEGINLTEAYQAVPHTRCHER
jgi:hypothetical protein